MGQAVDATGAGGINVTATLGYDSLNRLASTQEGGSGTAAQGYEYDSVGNRWVASGQTLSQWTPATANWYDGATNRITNAGVPNGTFQYDAGGDGNMTSMGGSGLTYDAEGRQVTATLNGTTQYWYDGDGRRVKKQVGTGMPTVYVYDASGELAAEYGGAAAMSGTQYVVQDHLGSTRMVVDGAGNCQALHDYLSFGEEILQGVWGRTGTCVYGGADGATQKFTGKERDAELASSTMQGLDYFGARYFSGAQGRFTSPDPGPYKLEDPQTFNRYAYVNNANRDPHEHTWSISARLVNSARRLVHFRRQSN